MAYGHQWEYWCLILIRDLRRVLDPDKRRVRGCSDMQNNGFEVKSPIEAGDQVQEILEAHYTAYLSKSSICGVELVLTEGLDMPSS